MARLKSFIGNLFGRRSSVGQASCTPTKLNVSAAGKHTATNYRMYPLPSWRITDLFFRDGKENC
jgi:hypothetical protein